VMQHRIDVMENLLPRDATVHRFEINREAPSFS
jgi:hypothetical protein